MADASPAWQPVRPAGLSRAILYAAVILAAACIIVVGLRMWTRHKMRCTGTEDWLITAALPVVVAQHALASYAVYSGLGAPSDRIPNPTVDLRGRRIVSGWHLLYISGWLLVRLSVCTAVLRITPHQRWRRLIYAIIALVIFAAAAFLIPLLVLCLYHNAMWRPEQAANTTEIDWAAARIVIAVAWYFLTAVNIIYDLTITFYSLWLLSRVRINMSHKLSVTIALSMATIVSAANIIRIPFLVSYCFADNYLYDVGYTVLLSVTESGIDIIAASLPMLFKLASYATAMLVHDKAGILDHRSRRSPHQPPDLITIGQIRSQRRGPSNESRLSLATVRTLDLLAPPQRDTDPATTSSGNDDSQYRPGESVTSFDTVVGSPARIDSTSTLVRHPPPNAGDAHDSGRRESLPRG